MTEAERRRLLDQAEADRQRIVCNSISETAAWHCLGRLIAVLRDDGERAGDEPCQCETTCKAKA